MTTFNFLKNFKNIFLENINVDDSLKEKELGKVIKIDGFILTVIGFSKIMYNEAVLIANKYVGFSFLVNEKETKIVLLDKTNDIKINDEVIRTKKYIEIPISNKLFGRVIDPLGRELDNKDKITYSYRLPIERKSKEILDRKEVNRPLETGIKIIDCFIPIGKGQRQLIIGDRQTGKTSIAIDTILNQKNKNVICIYCAIGQKKSSVVDVVNTLKKNNAMDYTIIVNASTTETPAMQYIAPFSATSIAEYFCEKGKDVLIIYDDLSKHAKSYREISLLLEKIPTREAYPSDIFYLHSRLLERSVNLIDELGGGSITSFPIIETEGENISSYISTNVISITDGQIYLSVNNFQKSLLPAIDVGKSVSRIGGKAQYKGLNQVSGGIKISYSQFEEIEMFSK